EQHRVHRVVAHTEWFSLFVAHNQVRIQLFDLFGYKAELWDTIRINLLLIPEGNRFELHKRVTSFVHWFDLILETRGRSHSSELALLADDYRYPCNCDSSDAGHKGSRLCSVCADADPTRVAQKSIITDIDVVAASGDLDAGLMAYRDIVLASGETESINT